MVCLERRGHSSCRRRAQRQFTACHAPKNERAGHDIAGPAESTLAGMTLVFAFVTVRAALLPARRATRVYAPVALRAD